MAADGEGKSPDDRRYRRLRAGAVIAALILAAATAVGADLGFAHVFDSAPTRRL